MRADISATAKTPPAVAELSHRDFTESSDNHITTHPGLINAFPVPIRCPNNTDAMAEGHRLYVKYVAIQRPFNLLQLSVGVI